jgi:short-subunit dehydrogenase
VNDLKLDQRDARFGLPRTACNIGLLLMAFSLGGCVISPQLQPRDRERIEHKTFVITGASSGFGRGTALVLAARHANVVLAARRVDLLEEVATQVRAAGGEALVVATDVGRAEDVQALAQAAIARFGRIDVWINNAGVGVIGPFEAAPLQDLSRLVDVNLKGVIYGSHVAIRQFKAQGVGTLVNVASIDSEVPLAYQAAYSSTKAGVLALTRALNEELRLAKVDDSIRVASVLPWAADTPWWPHAANYSGHQPRNASMDDPQLIADAIAWISVHPREELPVGWKARASYDGHHLMPDLTERMAADIQYREALKGAPLAPTHGSLFEPMASGRDVGGGVVERMKMEDALQQSRGGQ